MTASGASDWDAATYDRISGPALRWGSEVLGRLALTGSETVLDAGCGTGRVTERLLQRLPHGRVIALDASPAMLAEARRRLATSGDRVEFLQADLLRPIPRSEPVDAVLSTATFHWILDHDTLFANLAAVLRTGGQLAAQCGGAGNLASVDRAVRRLGGERAPKHYSAAEEAAEGLERAGFTDVRTWMTDEPTPLHSDEELETYLRTIVLRVELQDVPSTERTDFVGRVASALPERVIDYVRLNILARKA